MTKFSWLRLLMALIAFAGMGIGLSGCNLMPQVSDVDDVEQQTVLSYSEPMADQLFDALNQADYAAFSHNFDSTMKKAMKEKDFQEMARFFAEKVGRYQSRAVEKVEMVDEIYVITYQAVFEKEPAVSVRLSVRGGSPPQVAGLWFDSPKLRE